MSGDIKHTAEVVIPGASLAANQPLFVDADDPDDKYVLTMDNAKKILAIHQRLRYAVKVFTDQTAKLLAMIYCS